MNDKGYVKFSFYGAGFFQPPSVIRVCKTTDDYFDLVKFCWECIGTIQSKIGEIDLTERHGYMFLNSLYKCLKHLFDRIDECYDYLKWVDNTKGGNQDVYTTTLSHEASLRKGSRK